MYIHFVAKFRKLCNGATAAAGAATKMVVPNDVAVDVEEFV